MPLWLVIIIAGATGCGWLFLRAREMDAKHTLMKVKEGHKSVKKAAKHATGYIGEPPVIPPPVLSAEEPVQMSKNVSNEIAEILEKKGL